MRWVHLDEAAVDAQLGSRMVLAWHGLMERYV